MGALRGVLCLALSDVLYSDWFLKLTGKTGLTLGPAVKVVRKNVVCFVDLQQPIKVGDILVVKNHEEQFKGGPVLEMQVNGANVTSVDSVTDDGVGLRVDFTSKASHEFFLVPIGDRPNEVAAQLEQSN